MALVGLALEALRALHEVAFLQTADLFAANAPEDGRDTIKEPYKELCRLQQLRAKPKTQPRTVKVNID